MKRFFKKQQQITIQFLGVHEVKLTTPLLYLHIIYSQRI
jgi:hypothetical protein